MNGRATVRTAAALFCFGAAAALVIAAGLPARAPYTGVFQPDGALQAPEIGAFAPDFTALTLSGRPVVLSAHRGAPIIINFWATWCIPCEIELPELIALSETGVRVLAVNLSEPPALVSEWLRARAAAQTDRFIVPLDLDGAIAARYALRGQPTSFVLAPDGKITHIFFGAADRSAFERAVAPFR